MNNVPFGLRGVTQEDLAKAIGSSRAHVCQVLNGVLGRGGKTRKKLAPLLEKTRVGGWEVERMGNGRLSLSFHAEQNVPITANP